MFATGKIKQKLRNRQNILKTRRMFTALLLSFIILLTFSACEVKVSNYQEEENTNTQEVISKENEEERKYEEQKQKYIGNPIPEFKMLNLSGNLIDLSEIKGPYLLYFSRVDCPACIEVFPLIENLQGVGTPAIKIYRRDSKNQIVNLYKELGFEPDYQTLLSGIEDPDNNTVLDTFDLIAVPTIFFVDGNNTVTWIHVGSTTYDKLRDMADNYLQD